MVKNPLVKAEIQVQSLVWEDPTCCRATNPAATTAEPELYSPGATTAEPIHAPQLPGLCAPAPVLHMAAATEVRSPCPATESSHRSAHLDTSPSSGEDPAQPYVNKYNYV